MGRFHACKVVGGQFGRALVARLAARGILVLAAFKFYELARVHDD